MNDELTVRPEINPALALFASDASHHVAAGGWLWPGFG